MTVLIHRVARSQARQVRHHRGRETRGARAGHPRLERSRRRAAHRHPCASRCCAAWRTGRRVAVKTLKSGLTPPAWSRRRVLKAAGLAHCFKLVHFHAGFAGAGYFDDQTSGARSRVLLREAGSSSGMIWAGLDVGGVWGRLRRITQRFLMSLANYSLQE